MSDPVRFRPPPVELTPELDWVLRRAFGTGGGHARDGIDLVAAVALGRRLALAPRLGARARRFAELAGTGLDEELARETAIAAASELRALEGARQVVATAAAKGIPCCFLKGAALEAMGLVRPGTRPIADVDALVREQDARPLAKALGAVGFVGGGEEYPHQLPALTHPHLGSVELHRHLPGVRGGTGRRRFATLDDVDRAGLLAPWPGMPAGALLPTRELLTAHLLAHGLAQHGFRPTAYPPLRLIGDLIDLGIAEEGGRELLAEASALLSPAVAASEARAAAAAATRLAAADTAVVLAAIPAGVLLRHLLGGVLDPAYQRSLKLRELVDPLGEGGRLKRRVASLRQALTLSRGQVDSIYGRPRNGWGYATRRALRPFDLAWRAGRALLS